MAAMKEEDVVEYTYKGKKYSAKYWGHDEIDVYGDLLGDGGEMPLFTLHMDTETPTEAEVLQALKRYLETNGEEQPKYKNDNKHWYFR